MAWAMRVKNGKCVHIAEKQGLKRRKSASNALNMPQGFRVDCAKNVAAMMMSEGGDNMNGIIITAIICVTFIIIYGMSKVKK